MIRAIFFASNDLVSDSVVTVQEQNYIIRGVGTIRKLGGHQFPAALLDDERALKKWKTCAKCASCCT